MWPQTAEGALWVFCNLTKQLFQDYLDGNISEADMKAKAADWIKSYGDLWKAAEEEEILKEKMKKD